MTGDITIESKLIPSFGGVFRSLLAEEAVYRPVYNGTGVITLESSLGGFHVFDLAGDTWILEPGAYWASDGSVQVSFVRERFLTALWAGEGWIYLQTKVSGKGKVVVTTRGPVEEIQLAKGTRVVTEERCVICRTSNVSFSVRRPTKNFLGKYTSGENWVRVYEGIGTILLNPAPYWRYRLFAGRGGGSDYPARFSS
jgi:uncharacterized protein (AIM24 family)